MDKNRCVKENVHVFIGVPSGGQWASSFGTSLAGMCLNYTKYPVGWVKSIKISLNCVKSSMLAHNREMIVDNALKADATHVLFLDDDMVFPRDTLSHLLRWKKPFVAAQGVTKMRSAEPTAMTWDGDRLMSKEHERGTVEVKHVGLAVALVETKWLKPLERPLFSMPYVPEKGAPMGEDVFFCWRWREQARQKILVDVGLSWQIRHVGEYAYGMDDVETEIKTQHRAKRI